MTTVEILFLVSSFLLLMALGVPITVSLALSAVITLSFDVLLVPNVTTVSQRMINGLDSFTLLAIPFFILAGQIMNSGGIARRLIAFAKVLVGPTRGGLLFVNIIACALFGAISGSAAAAASAVGATLSDRARKEGYDPGLSAAVNATSSTSGLLIPPSNVLIIYSLAAGGLSIGALFLAGYIPGLLVSLVLMIVTYIIAVRKKYAKGETWSVRSIISAFLDALPSLLLLVLVIGGIVVGFFTATEASAVAVLYALILSFAYGEMNLGKLRSVLLNAALTTAIVLLLVSTSSAMSWVMSYGDLPAVIAESVVGLTDNPILVLLLINLILLAVGVFMDITPAVLIFTPIFLPVVTALGIDPIHFGIIMVFNLCIGLCTPPVGNLLFVAASVAGISFHKMLKPMMPLFLAMLLALLLIMIFPVLSLWLPSVFGYGE